MEINRSDLHILKCRASFHFCAKWMWTILEPAKPFVDSPYVKMLCDDIQKRIENIGNGVEQNGLICNIFPASGKTYLFTKFAPIYAWLKFPSMRILACSFNTTRAQEFATESRTVIESSEFQQYFPMELKADQNTKNKFQNNFGGSRTSIGSDSPAIGGHYDLLICDDVQTQNDIHSEIDRNRINTFATSMLGSRTGNNPSAQMWFINQRLSQKDITSHLENSGIEYTKISLPAELNDQATHPHLYSDGLLAPALLPQKRLDALKIQLGIETYESQFNQRPGVSEFALIRAEHFDIVDTIEPDKMHVFVDSAFTSNTKRNDPTAAIACTVRNGTLYITNIFQKWLEFNQLKTDLTEWVKALNGFNPKTTWVHIEPKASGQPLLSDLRIQSTLNVKTVPAPTESKQVRLQGISARVENHRVALLKAKWNNLFIHEVTGYSRHDDLTDCLIMAVNALLPVNGKFNYTDRIKFTEPTNLKNTKAYKMFNL